jgi:hypothetical protein
MRFKRFVSKTTKCIWLTLRHRPRYLKEQFKSFKQLWQRSIFDLNLINKTILTQDLLSPFNKPPKWLLSNEF